VTKNSLTYLKKLENLFKEAELKLRYEKGNFKSGYCILEHQKVVVVNKFYTVETKIQTLIEILGELKPEADKMSPESRKLLAELSQTTIKL
jgi:hypothetical protein